MSFGPLDQGRVSLAQRHSGKAKRAVRRGDRGAEGSKRTKEQRSAGRSQTILLEEKKADKSLLEGIRPKGEGMAKRPYGKE